MKTKKGIYTGVAPRTKYQLAHWTTDSTGKEVVDFNAYKAFIHSKVISFTRYFFSNNMSRSDFYEQVYLDCCLGFAKAVDCWKPEFNVKFITYLAWCVKHQFSIIQAYHNCHKRKGIRTIVFSRLNRTRRGYNGRENLWEPAAEQLPEPSGESEKMLKLMQRLKCLKTKWYEVIHLRYYLNMTLEEIATKLELSRERIRQIESKALSRLSRWERVDRERAKMLKEPA